MAANVRLICASEDLAEGQRGVRFEIERRGRLQPAFAVRHRGKAVAYLNRCAHLPAELDWNEGEFFDPSGLYLICATHGALYDPATGACVGGRCNGRGLEALDLKENGGQVFLMQEGC